MPVYTYRNGNKTELKAGKCIDIDIKPCPKCNQLPDKNGHDWCLGKLPGVKYACCGHGINKGTIFFKNGVRITFDNIEVARESKLNLILNIIKEFKNIKKLIN